MATSQDDFIQHILNTVQIKQNTQSSFFNQYFEKTYEFLDAIDWTQNWLKGLIGFHTICFITILLLRNHSTGLSIYFFVLLAMATLAKPLNDLGRNHWENFASANYFDDSGLFIVSIYALPLVFNSFVTLILILKTTAGLLIDMKRKQIKRQQKNKNNNKKKGKKE